MSKEVTEEVTTDVVEAFEVPESLVELSIDELISLADKAVEEFNSIYGDGTASFTEADIEALSGLRTAIADVRSEINTREEVAAELAAKAAELAGEVAPVVDDAEDDATEEVTEEVTGDVTEDVVEEVVVASAKPAVRRISLSGVRRQTVVATPEAESNEETQSRVFAGERLPGYRSGSPVSLNDVAVGLSNSLASYSHRDFAKAAKSGNPRQDTFELASFTRNTPTERVIDTEDVTKGTAALSALTNPKNLLDSNGALTASGGWCAPSEVLYDIYTPQGDGVHGLLDIPTAVWSRGGIRWATGSDFTDLYNNAGFYFTEDEDIEAADPEVGYDGAGGSKPCVQVPCPTFNEARLDVAGLCIQAGLLQARGYPEAIQEYLGKSLIAHEHRINAKRIAAIKAGSTAAAVAAVPEVGVAAPLLAAVELQATSIRYAHRLGDNAVIEAIFPIWMRGAFRADLAQRMGVDFLSVDDARLDAWLYQRFVRPQWVYDYQDLSGVADTDVKYPASIEFLLYPAGTWTAGTQDVVTISNVYDSTLLGYNDYTALFTEEGVGVAKRGTDSRVITVPIDPNGVTARNLVVTP